VNGHLHGNGKGREIEGKEESDAMGIGMGRLGKQKVLRKGNMGLAGEWGREGKMT